jgi:hypothetical protein
MRTTDVRGAREAKHDRDADDLGRVEAAKNEHESSRALRVGRVSALPRDGESGARTS